MESMDIGIKALCEPISAQCIKILRDILGISISEIKSRISNSEYIYSGDSAEDETIDTVIRIYEGLTAIGVECIVYEYGHPSGMEIIYNLRESYDLINKQVDDDPCC